MLSTPIGFTSFSLDSCSTPNLPQQVHEKAILLPLLPVAMLVLREYTAGWLLGLFGVFSMFPLLQRDGLTLPYLVLLLSFVLLPVWGGVHSKSVSRRWNASGVGYVILIEPMDAFVNLVALAIVKILTVSTALLCFWLC